MTLRQAQRQLVVETDGPGFTEITEAVVEAIESEEYRFIRLNYPNGDMVGHTGVTDAVKVAIEAVDEGKLPVF